MEKQKMKNKENTEIKDFCPSNTRSVQGRKFSNFPFLMGIN